MAQVSPSGKYLTSSGGAWFECRMECHLYVFVVVLCDSMQMLNYYLRPRQIPHTCTGLDNITTFSPVRLPTKSFATPHVYFFQIFLLKPWQNIQSGAAFSDIQWQCWIGRKSVLLLPHLAAWKRNKFFDSMHVVTVAVFRTHPNVRWPSLRNLQFSGKELYIFRTMNW
jgi:hypothetical protein